MNASPPPANVLASYKGAKPDAPDWFTQALTHRPERHEVESNGAAIECFTWGNEGKPGLFLLHGGGAHGLWWAHIAPFFADTYRVAAMSMAGMGNSGWKDEYSIAGHAEDMRTVAEAVGLFAAGKPVVAGHSFGSAPTAAAAADPSGWVGRAFIIDSSLQMRHSPDQHGPARRERRYFDSLEEGLARFRFLPPQSCDNHYVADMIARDGIVEIEPGRWSWSLDPNGFGSTKHLEIAEMVREAHCPMAVLYGERSALMDEEALTHLHEIMPTGTPFVAIPDSGHHIMVDQPLALVAAMRALLSG
ncbi:alpha/beta fold hydrolase [Parasphingopyxis lamellibrachiae]|uniref:Pimeloyl-ACP methyl ester carboxylesterase n=1 Tax=Parasphingopyxis lamellibrachiae TaxID=680125 RepID=A0A3D9FEL8_9SPHN|nr:alpha/beta hydrolase [Parasphingopyxis lamellibrachiae]RED16274.1 pimeloyl-ACP methyl ester carboxylesterase [Parasphingopyxis lamellibrachiae]